MPKRKSVYNSYHYSVKKRITRIQRGQHNFDYYSALAQLGQRAFDEKRFDDAYEKTQTVISYLELNRAVLLELVTRIHLRSNRFDEALAAADEIIEIAPEITLGYKYSGPILVHQGYPDLALELYDRALEAIPIFDSDRWFIEELKRRAQDRLEKRVDFFARLPVEVAHIIIDELDLYTDALTLFDVSRHWRDILTGYAMLWREFSITTRALRDYNMFRLMQLVGMHVQRLRVTSVELEVFQELTNVAVQRCELNNVQYLFVEDCAMDQYQLFQLLTLWGRSLVELRLHLRNEYEEALPIGRILNMCPNIQMFDYRLDVGTFEHQRPNGPPLRALPHNLESLVLIAPRIAAEILAPILRQCPRLGTLQIENSTGAALRPILTHGLNLVNIAVNGHIPRMTSRSTNVANPTGLRKLGLHHIVGMRPVDVIEMLERCQNTVQAAILILQGESNNGEQHRWRGLANVRADELKYLTYTAVSRDVHRYAAVMMRYCVNLESVTLSDIADLEGTALEEALASLPHLRVFKLHHVENVNADGLDRFFQAHARRGNSSSLQSVTLHTSRGITNNVLDTLSAIRTLQYLEIIDCSNAITTDGLLALARGLARSHSLRHVHLQEMVAVTDDVVRGFAAIAGLWTMRLSRLQTITADALEDIVYQSLNLQRVSIDFCNNIGEDTVRNINAILAYRRR